MGRPVDGSDHISSTGEQRALCARDERIDQRASVSASPGSANKDAISEPRLSV